MDWYCMESLWLIWLLCIGPMRGVTRWWQGSWLLVKYPRVKTLHLFKPWGFVKMYLYRICIYTHIYIYIASTVGATPVSLVWNQSTRVNWRIRRHGCTAKSEVIGAESRLFDCICWTLLHGLIRAEALWWLSVVITNDEWFINRWNILFDAFGLPFDIALIKNLFGGTIWNLPHPNVMAWALFLHQPAKSLVIL
jgi:hypothetical protein